VISEPEKAMTRFNAAVERADYLLSGQGDRLDVEQLIAALRFPGWLASSECHRAADELEAAAKEISRNHAGE
jgi:hypothetical protein